MFPLSGAVLRWSVLCALAASCVIVWSAVYFETPSGVLTFAVLDVGQGDALFIEGPTGIQVLVDGGRDSSVLRELPHTMSLFDRSLDALIETHPDSDHMGGFIDVLQRYGVGAFVEPGISKDIATVQALGMAVSAHRIPRYLARRGMVLELGGGAELAILYPDRDVTGYGGRTNDGCIVGRLAYGKTSALLTCDAPISVEEHLMSISSDALQSDILKVAHHGSTYSTGDPFLAAVGPKVAVVSVGANNSYGHPAARVLDALARFSIPVLRTDVDGSLVFISDGETFRRK